LGGTRHSQRAKECDLSDGSIACVQLEAWDGKSCRHLENRFRLWLLGTRSSRRTLSISPSGCVGPIPPPGIWLSLPAGPMLRWGISPVELSRFIWFCVVVLISFCNLLLDLALTDHVPFGMSFSPNPFPESFRNDAELRSIRIKIIDRDKPAWS
jgi:hypothetical protein